MHRIQLGAGLLEACAAVLPKIIQFLGYEPRIAVAQSLGGRIAEWRRVHGLRQEELTKRLGKDPSKLARWEKNRSQPSERSRARLEGILNCGLSMFE